MKKYIISDLINKLEKGHKFPVGTIRNGYIKVEEGIWKPYPLKGQNNKHIKKIKEAKIKQPQKQETSQRPLVIKNSKLFVKDSELNIIKKSRILDNYMVEYLSNPTKKIL